VVPIRDIMVLEVTIGEKSEQLMMEIGRFILVIILVLRCHSHRPSTDRSRWLIHISCLATLRQH
jgi:hypothetical protein